MPRRWAPHWALALSLLLLATPAHGGSSSNEPASAGGAASVAAGAASAAPPPAEWDNVSLVAPLSGRLPSRAYVTVAAVGGSVMLAVLGAALYQWRRRVVRAREVEVQRQRQAEEQAALEKARNMLHPVFIPPIIQNPDSSVHLGSFAGVVQAAHAPGCHDSPCCHSCHSCHSSGTAGEPAGGLGSPCPDCSAAGGSRHGHMMFVRGGESAFARVSLCRTSLSASTVDEGEGPEDAAAADEGDAAERGAAWRRAARGDAAGGGEDGPLPQQQQQALEGEPAAAEDAAAAAEFAAGAEAGTARGQ